MTLAERAGRDAWAPKVRFGEADRARIEKLAQDAGVSAPTLIRETTVRHAANVAREIRAARETSGRAPAKKEERPSAAPALNLDAVLRQRTGMPLKTMTRSRRAGRVTVGGAVYREETVTQEQIDSGLALDDIAV